MFIRLLPPGLTAWLHPWPDNELSLVAPYRSRRAPPDRYRAARGALLLALLLGCVGANAQKTRYVTDSLRLEARTGPMRPTSANHTQVAASPGTSVV